MDRSERLEPLLVRIERAAELTAISRAKAYQLVASGEWPSLRIGRSRRIPLVGLRSWLERRTADDGRGD